MSETDQIVAAILAAAKCSRKDNNVNTYLDAYEEILAEMKQRAPPKPRVPTREQMEEVTRLSKQRPHKRPTRA